VGIYGASRSNSLHRSPRLGLGLSRCIRLPHCPYMGELKTIVRVSALVVMTIADCSLIGFAI